ncbi:helix-turn-helix domain-containing protein [Limosilactobacillus gastricus]|uniref:helix-turn-helix domain-containing protein n=1 Tax=Limosilactobacillus gastricus TaxID=227942 RepID=UPI001299C246|nr:helix-turn-helix transcriptional regulator [Limosilactobacillus gastricus]QGF40519.1 helix-turn-helix domain-containing protein [Limosilactobacillus gastricus]
MDINRFVSRRKELGFSQVQLAQGICTQATLSKFENNGQIPSLNILQQLCNRLGLSLDELSQNDKDSIVYLNRQLKQAEIDLMIGNFLAAQECLSNISINSQSTLIHQMQFYLIRGLLELLLDQDHEGAIADFKLVTEELDQEQSTIWYYLGQAGLALVYDREQRAIAAKEHFKMVATYVDQLSDTAVENITDFEYVLAISYILGRYYWQNNFCKRPKTILTSACN